MCPNQAFYFKNRVLQPQLLNSDNCIGDGWWYYIYKPPTEISIKPIEYTIMENKFIFAFIENIMGKFIL